MTEEEWRAVPGWPEYEISNIGRVRRGNRVLKNILGTHGYFYVTLMRKPLKRNARIHRLVCEAFHGARPSPDHEVAHEDGTRTNNRPDNLRWATRKENSADTIRHGKSARGQKHHANLLTAANVIEIRGLLANGAGTNDLASRYQVAPQTISTIKSGRTWQWLNGGGDAASVR